MTQQLTEKLGCVVFDVLTSPVEAISQRSTGSASLSRGQENMGAWWKKGRETSAFEEIEYQHT